MILKYIPVNCLKISILILGSIIVGLGLFSHFQSSWLDYVDVPKRGHNFVNIPMYKICQLKESLELPAIMDISCPGIWMERLFVAVIIISLILSMIVFAVGYFVDLESAPLKYIDLAFHGISVVLLLNVGFMYIVSALQIDYISSAVFPNGNPLYNTTWNFQKPEKIAAGSLAIVQSLFYGAVAFLVSLSGGLLQFGFRINGHQSR